MTEQDRKLISFDWAIKRLLRSKANFDVLEGFLSELLFEDIKIVAILESESNQESSLDKFNRVDIKVQDSKGEIIIIEIQFNNAMDFMQRILYSTAKAITEHINLGEGYSKVVKVISINILYFDLGEGEDYIYRGTTVFTGLHNSSPLKLNPTQQSTFGKDYPSDIFPEFYIIKVGNFDNVAKTPLDEWIYLLRNAAIKPSFKAKGIKKAGEILDVMNMTVEERIAHDRHIDGMLLANSWIATAEINGHNQGIIEGMAIGEKKGLAEGLVKGKEAGLAEGLVKGKEEGLAEGLAKGKEEGLAEGLWKGREEERINSIKKTIELLTEIGLDKEAVSAKIQEKFNLSLEEASKFIA